MLLFEVIRSSTIPQVSPGFFDIYIWVVQFALHQDLFNRLYVQMMLWMDLFIAQEQCFEYGENPN